MRQRPRGPWNELHNAAKVGSTERTVALLSNGSIDIDQQEPQGATPLMLAAYNGFLRVVRILLNKGASVSIGGDDGVTALNLSAGEGHIAVSEALIKAGADLEAKNSLKGATPLHFAAVEGHSKVMRALVEAGANPNCRGVDGATPLYAAAQGGHMDAVKLLVRAKANPLLTTMFAGQNFTPMEIAAQQGRSEVVRWMIEKIGVEGCGDANAGVAALVVAAVNQYMDTMALLTDAAVVDTGMCLINAAGYGREASVKFLLQQQDWNTSGAVAYVNNSSLGRHNASIGQTPLGSAIFGVRSSSPRIVRLLVDAGADTTFAVRMMSGEGRVIFDDTPLAVVTAMLREKNYAGKDATQEQMHRLEGVRRLLLRVEAVHATSWLWPIDIPSTVHAAEGTARTKLISTPVTLMLPILRRRAARPRVLLAAVIRYMVKIILVKRSMDAFGDVYRYFHCCCHDHCIFRFHGRRGKKPGRVHLNAECLLGLTERKRKVLSPISETLFEPC